MLLRCSSFHKNLSAFIDDELDSRERTQMERHISECMDCGREADKLQEMVRIVRSAPRSEAPADAWAGTLRKIETTSEKPARRWGFSATKWQTIPAGVAVLALLLYLLSGHLFFHGIETGPMSIAVYLQEYEFSGSQQVLSPVFLSDLITVQTDGTTEESGTDESMSELDMLVEVHYGVYAANGT